MRRLACLLPPLLLALAVGACGSKASASGVRVRLLVSRADGALQGDLKLELLGAGTPRVYDAHPVSSSDPLLFVAPGAPPGAYLVYTTASWGMLWASSKGMPAPHLEGGDRPATLVRMGRPRSLYVAAADPTLPSAPVGSEWAADWRPSEEGGKALRPAHLQVQDQGQGIMALRFPPQVWKTGNTVRVLGRMGDGSISQLLSFVTRPRGHQDLPRLVLVYPAPGAPLRVHLVPPPGQDAVPDGTPVRVTLTHVPLAAIFEEKTYRGVARFDALPVLGQDLLVELPRSGARGRFALGAEAWRRRQAIHLVAQHLQEGQATACTLQGVAFVEARVCYRGGHAFGLVPLEPLAGKDGPPRCRLLTQPGWQEWWLRSAAGSWYHHALDVPLGGGRPIAFPGPGTGPGAHLSGVVRGAGPGQQVVLRRVETPWTQDGEQVLPARKLGGEGLQAAISLQGQYDLRVPAGRYEIQVVGSTGAATAPQVLAFRPGQEVLFDPSAR